jgi:hypothetical protein
VTTNESPSPAFAIVWHIDDSEWEEAARIAAANPPGSYYDRYRRVFLLNFHDRLQLAYDGELMFKPRIPNFIRESDSPEEADRKRKWADENSKWDQYGLGGLTILDFAGSMAYIVSTLKFEDAPVGTLTAWRNCDDPNAIFFRKDSENILIWHSRGRNALTPPGPPEPNFDDVSRQILLVPHVEFFSGARTFLNRFVAELETHAPDLLEWDSLRWAVAFRTKSTEKEARFASTHQKETERLERQARVATNAAQMLERLPPPTFQFKWGTTDEDWREAIGAQSHDPRGSHLDTSLGSLWELFRVQVIPILDGKIVPLPDWITCRHEQMDLWADKSGRPRFSLSGKNTQWSLIDLALQLCRLLNPDRFCGPGDRQKHWTLSDTREFIGWDDIGSSVIIRPSLLDELEQVVGKDRFLEGARYFIADFVAQVGKNAPALLDWQTFDPIVEFIEAADADDQG